MNMTSVKMAALVALMVPCIGLQVACGPAGEALAFAAIEAGTSGLVASLGLNGAIPAADVPAVSAIANTVITASQETVDEGRSNDTAAVKSTKIAGYLNDVLAQIAALPTSAQPYLSIISASIKGYLAIVAPKGAVALADGSMLMPGGIVVPADTKLGMFAAHGRQSRLAEMRKKLTLAAK